MNLVDAINTLNQRLQQRFGSGIDSEQVSVLTAVYREPNAENAADCAGMLQDMRDRLGVATDDILPAIVPELLRLGFKLEYAGGGFQNYVLPLGNGLLLRCCDGESPDEPDNAHSVWFGVQAEAHCDLNAGKVYASGLELALILSAR